MTFTPQFHAWKFSSFFQHTLTEDFQFIGSQGSLKRDVMAQVSCPQWYPAACQSLKKMFQGGKKRKDSHKPHISSQALCKLIQTTQLQMETFLFYSVSNADEE